MSKQTLTQTRFRPAPLAASLALLWSGASLAVPGEPVLDWIEPEYVLGESNQSAEIKVSWQRFYGDPALTARYLLNDELVLTRAAEAGDAEFEDGEQSGGATLSIDRAGEHEIVVELCNAEGCMDSEPLLIDVWDASVDSAADAMASLDTQAEAVSLEETERRFAEIDAILAPYANDDDLIQSSARDSWGSWLAGLVGQSVLKYGIGMGLDSLVNLIGLGNRGPDLGQQLNEIQQSLHAIHGKLAGLANQIDVNHAEGLFHTTNNHVLDAISKVRTVSQTIAGMEETGIGLSDGELGDLAYANAEAAGLLQTHASGARRAVDLMLDYYQLEYPVSSGIEVREIVDEYVDGVRAAFGAAVLNQAWLREARPDNQVYDYVEGDAINAVVTIYAKVGAPYPQLSDEPSGFIHRVGNDWAMLGLDQARPVLPDEGERFTTRDHQEVYPKLQSLGAGVNAPGNMTIGAYMIDQGVTPSFVRPNSAAVIETGKGTNCRRHVVYYERKISFNDFATVEHRTWSSNKFWCAFPPPMKKAEQERAKTNATINGWLRSHFHTVNVTTNAWGMPALMDEGSIESHRDGIYVDAIDRGQGDAVTVTYEKNGYNWLQIRNPANGNVHYTGPNTARTRSFKGTIEAGALELVQGHRIGNRDGEGSILPKERTVVFVNPNSPGMTLTLDPI